MSSNKDHELENMRNNFWRFIHVAAKTGDTLRSEIVGHICPI